MDVEFKKEPKLRKQASKISNRRFARKSLPALMCMTLACCAATSFVGAAALPVNSIAQPASNKTVRVQVDQKTSDASAQKPKALLADAAPAVAKTEQALYLY